MVISGAFRPGATNWHITATCGILGAAAAAGRVLGLTPDQMIYALGLAATQAAGVTDVFGSMTKPFHAGRAAQGGLTAALLAQRGFTSSRRILEAPHGFINAMSEGYDLDILTSRLGEQWELPRVGLKPYPCGAGNHALIDAMLALRGREGATVDNIERVVAQVRSAADQLIRQRHPTTGLETKFSYFHAMAAAFVDGAAFPAQFTLEKANDPTIAGLRDRITVSSDPSLFGRSAVVTLTLKDGRSYTERIPHPTGTPEKPMSDDEVSSKFRALADGVLPREQAEALLASLWDLSKESDFRAVMRLATSSGAGTSPAASLAG
jgi:2-methylcitrate dehydratase PrpD